MSNTSSWSWTNSRGRTLSRSQRRKRGVIFILGLVVALGGLYFLHVLSVTSSCHSDEHRVLSPGGTDYVAIQEVVCDNLGGSDAITLSVRTENGDTPVFVFNPSSFSGPVTVTWFDAHTIDVTVERVQLIETQLSEAKGITVRYHIGARGEPVGRLRPTKPSGGI